jgi:hypothetical protein
MKELTKYLMIVPATIVFTTGCLDNGDIPYDSGASGDSDTDTDSDADADINASSGELTVEMTTSSTGGMFASRHLLAVWIENASGDFIHTLMAYTANSGFRHYLSHWKDSTSDAGVQYDMTDAVSGATRSSHGDITATWDGSTYSDAPAGDGEYQVCMELTDKDATGNYSCFSFTKSADEDSVTPNNAPSFSDVAITWIPE